MEGRELREGGRRCDGWGRWVTGGFGLLLEVRADDLSGRAAVDLDLGGQVMHHNGLSLGEDKGPFDHIAQLADVAWPAVVAEALEGRW